MVTMTATPRFIVRLPPDLRADLKRIADKDNRTISNLMIHALREWLAGRGLAQESK